MGIFDKLFSHKTTNVSVNKTNEYYQFDTINEDEQNLIMKIIKMSNKADIKSLEFYSLSNNVIYKCRYILFELMVLKYKDSPLLYDQLVTGLAYKEKGAFYRPAAIEYIQNYVDKANNEDWFRVNQLIPKSSILLILSELYEKEYDFTSALSILSDIAINEVGWDSSILRAAKILKKIDINKCVEYCEKALTKREIHGIKQELQEFLYEAKKSQAKGYVYRPRKNRVIETDKQMDDEINSIALSFLKYMH